MADVSSVLNGEFELIDLPPGFRFHPTDEEIITHYLSPKVANHGFTARAIEVADLNKCEPWDLPSKAKMGEKEWYFFCHRDRKYPTGTRTNRATEAGFWKATGKDKAIFMGRGVLVGMKKTLVFYRGRAPKGEKTNWVMHEYRLEGTSTFSSRPASKDAWVVCRVIHKDMGLDQKSSVLPGLERIKYSSTALPPLMDPLNNSTAGPSSSFSNNKDDESFDFKNNIIPASFSSMMGTKNQQQVDMNVLQPVLPQSSYYYSNYLHQDEEAMLRALQAAKNIDASSAIIRRHGQMQQQSSNQSMGCPSQETGLSTDHNTEISSVVSKQYDDLDDPSSTGPAAAFYLENIWKY